MREAYAPKRNCALSVLFLVMPSMAWAQGEDAEALIRRGVELRRSGQDEQALSSFEAALRAQDSPRARAQIGFALQALGRWVTAERSLLEASNAREDTWIRRHRPQIQASLQEIGRHLGSLTVTTNAPRAELVVDGFVLATLPMSAPLRLPIGPATLTIRADGYVPMSRTVTIDVGVTSRESFDLAPDSLPLPDRVVHLPVHGDATPMVPRARRSNLVRTAAWVTGGLGVATTIAGAVMLGVYNDTATQWNDFSCVRNGGTRGDNCRPLLDAALLQQGVMAGLFVTAGVLAVSSAILFGVSSASPALEARLPCLPTLESPGIVCGGSM